MFLNFVAGCCCVECGWMGDLESLDPGWVIRGSIPLGREDVVGGVQIVTRQLKSRVKPSVSCCRILRIYLRLDRIAAVRTTFAELDNVYQPEDGLSFPKAVACRFPLTPLAYPSLHGIQCPCNLFDILLVLGENRGRGRVRQVHEDQNR